VFVVTIILAFAFLAISFARHSAPTFDEVVRLPAGISYLRWHDYRLNPDHPPLLKKLVTLPLVAEPIWPAEIGRQNIAMNQLADWRTLPDSRAVLENAWTGASVEYFQQWIFAHAFLYGVRDETIARLHRADPTVVGPYSVPGTQQLSKDDFQNDSDRLLFRARLVIVGLGVLLALCVYTWSRELFGVPAAILSLLLLCFDPNMIAHSGLISGDLAETFFIVAALYFLWRICRRVESVSLVLFLLCFAAAFAAKFSATSFIVIFWVALLPRMFSPAAWPNSFGTRFSLDGLLRRFLFVLAFFVFALLTTFLLIWAMYDFRYSAVKNGSGTGTLPIEQAVYRQAAMKSELKRVDSVTDEERAAFDARVAQLAQAKPRNLTGKLILFAARHHILPEAYLYGFAHTNMDPLMRRSFLRGHYSPQRFRSAYFWAFVLKTPIPTMFAITAAIIFAVVRRTVRTWNFFFIASAIVVFFMSITVFAAGNVSHRYLLPIYPLLYLFCGVLGAEWLRLSPTRRRIIAISAVLLIVVSSQFVFYPPWRPATIHPHYLAYFNEFAGGPWNGYRTLVDSNLDWGQELKDLRSWLAARNVTEPIWLSYFGMADARWYQISHINVPKVLGGYVLEASPYSTLEDSGAADKAVQKFLDDLRPGQYLAISATNLAAVYLGPHTRAVWKHLLRSCTYVDQVGYSMLIFRLGREEPNSGE